MDLQSTSIMFREKQVFTFSYTIHSPCISFHARLREGTKKKTFCLWHVTFALLGICVHKMFLLHKKYLLLRNNKAEKPFAKQMNSQFYVNRMRYMQIVSQRLRRLTPIFQRLYAFTYYLWNMDKKYYVKNTCIIWRERKLSDIFAYNKSGHTRIYVLTIKRIHAHLSSSDWKWPTDNDRREATDRRVTLLGEGYSADVPNRANRNPLSEMKFFIYVLLSLAS